MDIAKNAALLLTGLIVSGLILFFNFEKISAVSIMIRLLVIVVKF